MIFDDIHILKKRVISMIYDNRQPLPNGTEIHCKDNSYYTICSDTISRGGSSLIYTARKNNSERIYIIKECFPLTERFSYIRNTNWQVVPASPTDKKTAAYLNKQINALFQENRNGQLISAKSARSIVSWEIIRADALIINGVHFAVDIPFIVMEQLGNKGCSLQDILHECSLTRSSMHLLRASGSPDIYTVVSIIAETLKALDEVHKAGYFYGDIQGNNLYFLNPHFDFGDIGIGCLLDFGTVQKLCEDRLTEEITDQEIYSTEGYTAPEILFSNDGHLRLSPAADIFSVGCLFLYLIKGENYARHQGKNISRIPQKNYVDRRELISKGASELSASYITEILQCALSFDPNKRYKDAYSMLEVILELKALCRPKIFENTSAIVSGISDNSKTSGHFDLPKYTLLSRLPSSGSYIDHSRDEDIERLTKEIDEKQPLWIWGFAGIGKSELAIKFAETQKKYRECYFIHYSGSLKETICNLNFNGYFTADKNREYLDKLNFLRNNCQDALLVIDNFNSTDKNFKEMISEPAYQDVISLPLHILFTTRLRPDYTTPELMRMDKEFLLRMFRNIVSDSSISDSEIIRLIDKVNGHSLFMELSAKLIEERLGEITIQTILDCLDIGEESLSFGEQEVESEKDRLFQETTIENHLKKLFDLAVLPVKSKKILWFLSIMPVSGIMIETFKEIFSSEDINQVKLLIKSGWIKQINSNFTIHPLLKTMYFMDSMENNDWKSDEHLTELLDHCLHIVINTLVYSITNSEPKHINEMLNTLKECCKLAEYLSDDQIRLLTAIYFYMLPTLFSSILTKENFYDVTNKCEIVINSIPKLICSSNYQEAVKDPESFSDSKFGRHGQECINTLASQVPIFQKNLGAMYLSKFAEPKNHKKAITYLTLASNNKVNPNSDACQILGHLYLYGTPIYPDFNDIDASKALYYLKKAKYLGRNDVDDLIEKAKELIDVK